MELSFNVEADLSKFDLARTKVLFCGYLDSIFSKSRQRFETLRDLGVDLSGFNIAEYRTFSLFQRMLALVRPRFPERAISSFNRDFLDRVAETQPHVVWVEKALILMPEVLAEAKALLPDTIFVSLQTDTPFSQRYREWPWWSNFISCIPYYDIHFVYRDSDLESYRRHGARRVSRQYFHFYPPLHHPWSKTEVPPHCCHDVVFVGTALDHRVNAMCYLMSTAAIRVDVYGNRWNRHLVYHRHRQWFHGPATAEYPAIISGSKVCLGYVSSSNLDQSTSRSVEIPACGGFLLAERTAEHLDMYIEGKEAEFFGCSEECADKIHYYLGNEHHRLRVARAGHQRCLRSDRSAKIQMQKVLHQLLHLRGNATGCMQGVANSSRSAHVR